MTFAPERKRLMVANWKMNKTLAETRHYFRELLAALRAVSQTASQPMATTHDAAPVLSGAVEVVICPPFTALAAYREMFPEDVPYLFALGAQNMHMRPSGAFTGEISAAMLLEHGVTYVIIGHSERRQYAAESDEAVAEKSLQALKNGLVPIVCIGETADERAAGETEDVLLRQLRPVLQALALALNEKAASGETSDRFLSATPASNEAKQGRWLDPDQLELVIAYEPVWAIGTGQAATPDDAAQAATFVRKAVEKALGARTASRLRILYGGSVTPDNISGYLEALNIDGALVGGASLDIASWLTIIERARRVGDAR
ncbi:MAG: Triosephosphate isomerase [Candidatus Carbobacillus altaicus]|uniref:Triosephosphate isomerase n=1 Tax=Candidatus Carbonibacillus altaicus TaxID=2163959 RepID=A0A2R6XY83_9BACL|nr:MAG: Triosephosphate isomerase [Candidatus Carbobacillus altaicus]